MCIFISRTCGYSQGNSDMAVARYTLAVDRRFGKRDGEQTADFIPCVAFGKSAEFAERYLHQGMKIAVNGRIQTGSYTNRDGVKVYTTDVIVEDQEFVESKSRDDSSRTDNGRRSNDDGFMNIGNDSEIPFL